MRLPDIPSTSVQLWYPLQKHTTSYWYAWYLQVIFRCMLWTISFLFFSFFKRTAYCCVLVILLFLHNLFSRAVFLFLFKHSYSWFAFCDFYSYFGGFPHVLFKHDLSIFKCDYFRHIIHFQFILHMWFLRSIFYLFLHIHSFSLVTFAWFLFVKCEYRFNNLHTWYFYEIYFHMNFCIIHSESPLFFCFMWCIHFHVVFTHFMMFTWDILHVILFNVIFYSQFRALDG